MTTNEKRQLLHRIIESGLQIAPDALSFIMDQDSPSTIVDLILTDSSSDFAVITVESLQSITDAIQDSRWDILIQKNPDINLVGSEGTVDDFLSLFRSRFTQIKQIYEGRLDTSNALSPAAAKLKTFDTQKRREMIRRGLKTEKAPNHNVIGMIKSKKVSQSGNIIFELEDFKDSLLCIIPGNALDSNGRPLSEKGNSLLIDEVICVSGYVNQDQRMIVRDIIFPDIPAARISGCANRDVYAVFISDLHVGSQEFLEDEFHGFINWLRGIDVNPELKHVVEQTRYLFIAGDLIDGIGVYPGQRTDLLLPDVYDQYKMLSKFLKMVPDKIKIICIPGNHDACRQALPKPPIPKQFAKPLYDLGDQISLLGDPSQVRVEGVSVLLTHGDSQDDLVTNIPGVSYKEPGASMKELLKKRHLAPIYGGKTEIAPLRTDWMVIDQVPDIVHFGHAHHHAVGSYHNVLIINSSTFQAQTEFMKKQGIDPTPGIVTYVNLHSGKPNSLNFIR